MNLFNICKRGSIFIKTGKIFALCGCFVQINYNTALDTSDRFLMMQG